MRNIVICSDPFRRAKIGSEFRSAGLEPEFMDGVIVGKNEMFMGHKVARPGNVGCMLAKIKAWGLASSGKEPCNIVEDDEVIPPDYLARRTAVMSELSDYDFVFLNALRPAGINHSESFLKISKRIPNRNSENGFPCNVWNSNYVITPEFGAELAKLLLSHPRIKDVSGGSTSDWIISDILHGSSEKRKIFVVKQSDLLSIHDERISIRKSRN